MNDREDQRQSSVGDQAELSIERVIELARKISTGMLVTETDEGLRSRPMSVAEVTEQGPGVPGRPAGVRAGLPRGPPTASACTTADSAVK